MNDHLDAIEMVRVYSQLRNAYESNIFFSAKGLVDAGLGSAEYITQFSSGSTCWKIYGQTRIIKKADPDGQALTWAKNLRKRDAATERALSPGIKINTTT